MKGTGEWGGNFKKGREVWRGKGFRGKSTVHPDTKADPFEGFHRDWLLEMLIIDVKSDKPFKNMANDSGE